MDWFISFVLGISSFPRLRFIIQVIIHFFFPLHSALCSHSLLPSHSIRTVMKEAKRIEARVPNEKERECSVLKWSERSGTNEPRTHLTPLVFILSLHSFISHTTITLLWCVFHWIKTSGKNRSACLIQWNKTPHFINFRILEIHKFYNLQLFYWHFLEILWLFIFLVFYLFIFWSYIFTFRIYNYILGLLSGTLAYSCRFTLYSSWLLFILILGVFSFI